jgi:multidrug resistance efflux pump
MSTRAGGWNGVPQPSVSTGESGATQALAGLAGTVIVGRPCHSVSSAPAQPVWLGAPASAAPEAVPGELGLARVHPQPAADNFAAPPSGPWRVTRTFGGASLTRHHSLVALRKRQASRRESLRLQGLRLERALAEARRVEARRTQARRARDRRPPSRAATLLAHVDPGAPASFAAPRSRRRALALASLALLVAMAPGLVSLPLVVRAPAALRPPGTLRSIESALVGAVTEVLTHAGAEVAEGQVIARLQGAELAASLALRQRELEALHQAARHAARAEAVSFGTLSAAIERERLALARREVIARAQHEQQLLQVSRYREAAEEGLVINPRPELDARAALEAAETSVAALGTRLAELDATLAEHEQNRKRRELERSLALAHARAAVDEAVALHALAEVRSPIAGRVESVVSPGAPVRAGEVLAQIAPSEEPHRVIAFVPASKARFVHVGMDADVTPGSPRNEAARARARVSRVPAGAADVGTLALGDRIAGSSVPVELLLLDETPQATTTLTRSGEKLLVHLHAGRQRLPVLLYELIRSFGA